MAGFLYLRDAPRLLASGEVQRYPMLQWQERDGRVVDAGPLGGGYYVLLYTRRRRCQMCRHRHGPHRNVAAKVCACRSATGAPCGCRYMTDWPSPAEYLTRTARRQQVRVGRLITREVG